MSGRAYTMKEMKAIVDYITEHKAYSEIKGRNMWKNLADSKVTTRTWQSLKETFLKRIFPDIHNPYYKLSVQQISSFRQGYDIETRISNRLQIRSASRESNSEDGDKANKQSDNINDNNEEEATGEVCQKPESDLRASTETLVLENFEENPDESNNQSPTKSMRELITYSEPLTPMLQGVIDDFATDGEGSNDEPIMQIVEQPESDNNDKEDKTANSTAETDKPEEPQAEIEKAVDESLNTTTKKIQVTNETESKVPVPKESETVNENGNSDDIYIVLSESDKEETPNIEKDLKKTKTSTEITQNSNTTTDTLLPNNQEALKENSQTTDVVENTIDKKQSSKRGKKRSISQENSFFTSQKLVLKGNEKQSASDTDAFIKNKRKLPRFSQMKVKKKVPEVAEEPLNENPVSDAQQDLPPEEDLENKTPENVEMECNGNNTEETENLCLKSVSLYEEQFSNKKYTDSETSNVEDNRIVKEKKEEKTETKKQDQIVIPSTSNIKKQVLVDKVRIDANEVVLKSHSDSLSDNVNETERASNVALKHQREKAMANMLGYTRGAAARNRRKRSSFRKYSSSREPIINISPESSEWASDTGSDYVSPPRGRRNRQTRKYLKPKSARILSLEEEGGLFVMHNRKIYPVVKDGKILKNYVTCTPEEDTEESFWKLKYVEEKKKTAELTKLLQQVKEKNDLEEIIIPVPTTSKSTTSGIKKDEISTKFNHRDSDIQQMKEAPPIKEVQKESTDGSVHMDKTIKIKFSKNNEEVQLEGHWSHVNPALAQVMQLFQKDSEVPREKSKLVRADSEVSGVSTPLVPVDDVKDKVNRLESAIFKEIEEREKEKTPAPTVKTPEKDNVTKRKIGRQQPTATITTATKATETEETELSPAKKPKLESKKAKADESSNRNKTVPTRRSTRTPKKIISDKPETTKAKEEKTKGNSPKKDEQNDVKYKLPSPRARKSFATNSNKRAKNTRQRKSSPTDFVIYTTQDNLSIHSVDSTQGYQDSDESPIKSYQRKKKKLSLSVQTYRTRSRTRSRKISHPDLTDDVTSDTSNSFQSPIKTITIPNSTLKSDVYKSESYQLLINNNVTLRNKSSSKLNVISETSPLSEELQYINDQICKDLSDFDKDKECQENENFANLNTDSSSIVTLPTSPVLSIVENISINKSLLSNSNALLCDGKLSSDNENIMLNDLMKTEEDVSMPLMEREYGIETITDNGIEYHYNINAPQTPTVSESFVNRINTVNIEDPSLSETIHSKLRDLILESVKKMQKDTNVHENCPKELQMKENPGDKTSKSKKRSSTPRKRQSTRKLKITNTEPCIEEEHMETCSYSSRKSCPAMMQIFEEHLPIENDNTIHITEPNTDKQKARKKKDIIKVKITKPKPKKSAQGTSETAIDQHRSIQTDSGINDTVTSMYLNTANDTVDLIHNHSETCLNANECLGDSVEIIHNSKSHISLNSDSSRSETQKYFRNIPHELAQELFSSDAQDVSVLQKVIEASLYENAENACETVRHIPLGRLSSPDSLITEDLSDDNEISDKTTPKAKWYLFSEDETNNTNTLGVNQYFTMESRGYGANLNQIFPIACAVPDLSTITEISKENEDNTRKSDDTTTRNDLDSQSLFN